MSDLIRLHNSFIVRLKNRIAIANVLPSIHLPENVRKYIYNILATLVIVGVITFIVGFVGQRNDRIILGLILTLFSVNSIAKVVTHFNQLHGQTAFYKQTV